MSSIEIENLPTFDGSTLSSKYFRKASFIANEMYTYFVQKVN